MWLCKIARVARDDSSFSSRNYTVCKVSPIDKTPVSLLRKSINILLCQFHNLNLSNLLLDNFEWKHVLHQGTPDVFLEKTLTYCLLSNSELND